MSDKLDPDQTRWESISSKVQSFGDKSIFPTFFWFKLHYFWQGRWIFFKFIFPEEEMIEYASHLNSKLVMAPWKDSIRRSKTSTIQMISKNIVLRQIFNWFLEASQVTCMQKLLHFNNLQQQDSPCIPTYFSRMVVFLDTFGSTQISSLIHPLKNLREKNQHGKDMIFVILCQRSVDFPSMW